MDKVYKYIIQKTVSDRIDKKDAVQLLELLKKEKDKNRQMDIAVIGMAAKTSRAENVREFWRNLITGVDSIREIPWARQKDLDAYLRFRKVEEKDLLYKKLAYLDEIDKFDYEYFNLPPREAELMDPNQRLFLETACAAIEDAGYSRKNLRGTKTGLYLGYITANYSYQNWLFEADAAVGASTLLANMAALIPSRVSYLLDLRGPSILVDTTCSSSLVAVHLACQALRARECEQAIVGGVKINLLPLLNGPKIGIESSSGKTLSFDEASDGTGQGEGVGVVMLKPLQQALRDGDNIQAIIKGSAINQDGQSMSLTAPNPEAQTEVIKAAWESAQIDPQTISYIEAHGTGTKLGDPIEIEGISKAFAAYTNKKQFCAVGSVKSNIGHLDEAAGIFGLIKTVMALQHKQLPASLNFHEPNHKIDWLESPVYVNDHLQSWPVNNKQVRRAGVSSFGLSGTNCHVVLEEARATSVTKNESDLQLLTLSAHNFTALKGLAELHYNFILQNEDLTLADYAYTLNIGRDQDRFRLSFVFADRTELLDKLEKFIQGEKNSKIYFTREKNNSQKKSDLNIDSQIQNLAEQALSSWQSTRQKTDLENLAAQFVKGAQIDWSLYFKDKKRQRLSLPTYPFARTRAWFKLPSSREKTHFELGWRQEDLEFEPLEGNEILFFKNSSRRSKELCRALEKEVGRKNLIIVELGGKFKKINENKYTAAPKFSDFEKLFKFLQGRNLSEIVFSWSLSNRLSSLEKLEELQAAENIGVLSLFHLVRALHSGYREKVLNLFVVADYVNELTGQEQIIKPENATVFGMARGLFVEFLNWHARAIDIDEETNIDLIVREIRSEYKNHKVAFRNSQRYIEEFRYLSEKENTPIKIRPQGVYLFTGGTSGIVLELIKYLSRLEKIKIILLNRSTIPNEDTWQKLIVSPNTSERLKNILKTYTEIQDSGSEIFSYSVDVSNEKELEKVLQEIKLKFGNINGIVHAAGIPSEKEFDQRSEVDFRNVLAAKVQGTWLLDHLTRDQKLDFFSLMSSAITCFGGIYNFDYMAANAYLDSYAFWGRQQGINFSAVNWPFWDKTGMHVQYVVNNSKIPLKNISPSLGVEEWYNSLSNKRAGLVIVGELNYQSKTVHLLRYSPFTFSPEIYLEFEKSIDQVIGERMNDHVELQGNKEGEYSVIEREVAQVLYDVLGYKEINVSDNFFDLGGDSLFIAEIFSRLDKKFPGKLNITQLFTYPTVAQLSAYLSQGEDTKKVNIEREKVSQDIAVIGLAARTSLADNYKELWDNLVNGRECIREIPENRKRDIDEYLRAAGAEEKYLVYSPLAYLSHIDQFDYEFFKFSPREAKLMDPSHRLFLETVITALETAGYGGEKLRSSNTGLYLGYGQSDFDYKNFINNSQFSPSTAVFTGNLSALIPSRISYLLDLRGPSMVIDTACSSSLVAIHVACQALLAGDCDQAIAGGVRLNLVPLMNRFKVGIESSDWYTRTFDDTSDGTGMGEGVAAVILKPLEKAQADGDQIWAVIKGSAVNQDGQSVGITAPNPRAQADVIEAAWWKAQIDPQDISYIEAHGTGTSLGDPIEIQGVTQAFRRFTDKKQFCAISAIKPNLGHTLEAAGIFSFIKAVLSLQHKQLLPSINFHEPNHRVAWEDSSVFINDKLRPWEIVPEKNRLCGVSSFGLSGTNCHIVLSEHTESKAEKKNYGRNIFTLSAKNETSFRELISEYLIKINNEPNIDWSALCYTANTGRGHYEYRLAILAESTAELQKKLNIFKNKNYQAQENQGIYFGYHRIIPGNRQPTNANEVSEPKISELTKQAKPFVNKVAGSGFNNSFVEKILKLYTQGALISWGKIYAKQNFSKVILPTYPFQKNRAWVDEHDQAQIEPNSSFLHHLHPLLEKCLVKSQGQDIYSTFFSAKKHFVLSDHIINGSHVLPGTVYLEIAKQLGILYYGDIPVEIRNLNFITPVITSPEEKKEVQIVVEEGGGFKRFYALSHFEGGKQGNWLRHVEGEIYPRPDLALRQVDIKNIINACQTRALEVDINKNAAGFINFGLRWQNYHRIGFGDHEALAELSLPKECWHDLETYYLHPPMLDMAAAAVSMATGFKALPFSYGSFRVMAPLPKKFYSHFKRIGEFDEVEETLSFDLELLDSVGRVLVEIDNFKLKKTRDFTRVIKRNRGLENDKYYKTVWENKNFSESNVKTPAYSLVLLGNNKRAFEIYSALKKIGSSLITVRFGEQYRQISENEFEIRNELADYIELLKAVKDRPLEQIIHLSALNKKVDIYNLSELEENQRTSVYALFYFIKALTINIVKRKIDIVLIAENAQKVTGQEKELRPENITLFGFGKAPALEDANWQCRSIDVDELTGTDKIISEIKNGYSTYKIAWRENVRYQEVLKHFNLESAPDQDIKIKNGGNYLISGGTGGLGLELAAKLAQSKKVNLFLINRTQLPPRSDWAKLIAEGHPLEQKIKNIIERVLEMEKAGTKVFVFKADIADYEETKKVIDGIRKKFGKLTGVFHVAGVPGDGFIAYKEETAIKNVFAPKIAGTLNLDRLTRIDNLDFLVLFSSSTALHSAPGQSDYTAANAFLDVFSSYRNLQGFNTIAIQWSGLQGAGMLASSKTHARYGTLTIEAGLNSLLLAMKKRIDNLSIGALVYTQGAFAFIDIFPIELSNEIKAELFQDSAKMIGQKTLALASEVKVKGGGSNEEMEKTIAQIWSEVLGVAEIDVNDHFFDLGGDSLRIAEVHTILESKYPGKFSVAELFAYPTIAGLIKHSIGEASSEENVSPEKNISTDHDIAIIGMAARTSFAENVAEFWDNLSQGLDCIREIPEARKNDLDNFLKFRGLDEKFRRYNIAAYLSDIDKFDNEFFRISPREAELMDPNQCLLLETVYHALENAGYNSRRLNNSKTGLYVGLFPLGAKYYDWIAEVEPSALSEAMVNNMEPTVASRISYYLNLVGPSMLINTACSSSLVAIHLACQAIRNGDCEQAIVGSIKINLLNLLNNPQVGIESKDGHTRSFDEQSDGTGLGEGVAAVMLKPLAQALRDGDNILSVIKGSAINQDGQSVGITAPNALSQTEVILSAWRQAGINPETISYLEAHGTGTNLGDPIEIEGISSAFRKFTNKKQFCAISSVKSNLGHLLEAAGIFGLVKAVLSLQHQQLLPTVNLHEPNHKVNWEDSPVYINDKLRTWENFSPEPRRAGVSSFGLSGTNSHVVIEEAPRKVLDKRSLIDNLPQIFSLSARSQAQLKLLVEEYYEYFSKNPELDWADICYTLNTGRDHHSFRLAFVASDLSSAQKVLQDFVNWDYLSDKPDSFEYGEFKIVPIGQKNKEKSEITEKEAHQLGRELEMIMARVIWGEQINEKIFVEISRGYVAGANFDWLKLYKGQQLRKLPLLAYPFARERAWLNIPGTEKFTDYYHELKWQRQDTPKLKTDKAETILVFYDNTNSAQKTMKYLAGQRQEIIKVKLGAEYKKINKNNFVIKNNKDDYKKLLLELKERQIAKILHMTSLGQAPIKSLEDLNDSQERGIFSLMYLTQAAAQYLTTANINLFLITENAARVNSREKIIQAENSPYIGFGKAVAFENPNLHCRSIDFDTDFDPTLLWQEISSGAKNYKTAYRRNERYIEELVKLDLSNTPLKKIANKDLVIRPNGVYLVTGGTGGIGLEVAKAIAKQAPVKLALLNRHGVPARSEWENILNADGPKDQRLLARIKSLQELETLGSELLLLEADVSDEKQLCQALAVMEEKFGRADGIFHAAGSASEGFIINKGKVALANTLAPKVQGTWLLGELTRDWSLDFFVLFSSAITLVSGLNVSDYTAANSYLDAYAEAAQIAGRPIVAINWATWENIGLSFGEAVNEKKQLLQILPIKTALSLLFDILSHDISRVVAGRINYESDVMYLGDYLPINFSAEIRAKTKDKFQLVAGQVREVELKGRADGHYSDLEKNLASIWSEVLGYKEIDIRDNFFELGGDSLSGIRLLAKINQQLSRNLSFRDILQHPSLSSMAQFLTQTDQVKYQPVIKKVKPKRYQLK